MELHQAKDGTAAAPSSKVALQTACVVNWMIASGTVVLFNKWLLSSHFPFPISLTMWHMLVSSILGYLWVHSTVAKAGQQLTGKMFLRTIVPIGALFSGTLWLSNVGYMHLSIPFVQMLKGLMPVSVFLVGSLLGTQKFCLTTLINMVVITCGVGISSYGELRLVWTGVICLLLSVGTESVRLNLVQVLLQGEDFSLNPMTMMHCVAPVSFVFLSIPWVLLEAPLLFSTQLVINIPIFILNGLCASGLNLAAFLLIGKTSALTLNVAGIVKDWVLMALSVALLNSEITKVSICGYILTFSGIFCYQHSQLTAVNADDNSKAVKLQIASTQSTLKDQANKTDEL